MKRTNQFKWLASGALLLAAMILPLQMKAQDPVVRTTLDEHDTPVDKGFTSLADALDEGVSGPTTFTLNADQVLSDGFTDSNYSDITFDLNGYTIDARYIRYEDYWDDEKECWVDDPSKPYTSYRSFDITGNLTIKNGTLKANICGTGDTKVFLLNNATLEGDDFSWQPATGIAIENSSTFSLNNYWGSGNFTFEKCTLDATSQVMLTGINSIGNYGNTPGGYRDILHRLQLPDGYVLKQPYSDFKYAIYQTSDLEDKANMKDITLTIKGSDALTDCTFHDYNEVFMYDEEHNNWNEYYLTCPLCHALSDEGAITSTDKGANYTSEKIDFSQLSGYKIPVEVAAAKACYSRTMANEWGTLCLPFELTINEEDTHSIYTLTAVTAEAVTITKVTEGSIAAGTPVLVKRGTGEAGIELNNQNVTIVTVPVTGSAADGLQLKGTFTPIDIHDEGYYLDSTDGKLYSISNYCTASSGDLHIPAFRAWFDGTAPSGARMLDMNIDDTTSLAAIHALTQGKAEIFDLSGNRRSELQQGVNIVNGKKVIVK